MYSGLETIAKTGEISLGLEEYHTHSLPLFLSLSLFLEYYQATHRKNICIKIKYYTRILNIFLCLLNYISLWVIFGMIFMKLFVFDKLSINNKKIN